jgi:putative phosphoribosyl transferase
LNASHAGTATHAPVVFRDRREAGRLLASMLHHLAGRGDVVVLALRRGGVPIGYEVALATSAPLDVFTVRKLGVPGHQELAMGAIGSGGAYVLNDDVITALGIPQDVILRVARRERAELERRQSAYRDSRPYPEVRGKVAVLIDDGLATGASMLAAVSALRRKNPARTIVAVPVAPRETCAMLAEHADEVMCYEMPEPFGGVGAWYEDFDQSTDEEVRALLNEAAARRAS